MCYVMYKRLLYPTALLVLNGCFAALPETMPPPGGTYRVATSITYNIARRTYLLHVPPDYSPTIPLPLVVVLHGAFSTGKQTEMETGFSDLADSERFLVAYPEGIGIFGLLQHWNAGHCCGKAAYDQVDDIRFIDEVINSAQQKLAVDSTRIYMAGMSNGGMLTYRFAAERTGKLAAAAVVSGAIGSTMDDEPKSWQMPQTDTALPIIIVHGLDDDAVPAEGGASPRKSGNRSYLPVSDAIRFWQKANDCETASAATISSKDSVKHLAWNICRDGSSLEYTMLAGWGHQWPAPWFTKRLDKDHPLKDFDATRRIWSFFSKYRRSGQ